MEINGYTLKDFSKSSLCGKCSRWNSDDIDRYGKATCPKRFKNYRISATDSELCGSYDALRKDREIEDRFNKIHDAMKGGCFITTAIVDVLGMDDDCVEMQTLRNFRNTVMQSDEAYIKLLAEYDIVGPKIALALRENEKSKEIAFAAFTKFIKPVVSHVQNGEIEAAINLYANMVRYFKEAFGIQAGLTSGEILEYKQSTVAQEMGHGYQRKRKEKNQKNKESL